MPNIFLSLDFQRIRNSPEIDRAAIPAHFAANGADTELVRDRRVGFDCEFDGAAMAAAFE